MTAFTLSINAATVQPFNVIQDFNWEVVFTHYYQEANRTVDWLANRGLEQAIGSSIHHDVPSVLGSTLYEDIKGVAWLRIVML